MRGRAKQPTNRVMQMQRPLMHVPWSGCTALCTPRTQPGGSGLPGCRRPCGQRIGSHLQNLVQCMHWQVTQVLRCTARGGGGAGAAAPACTAGPRARGSSCTSGTAAAARRAQAVGGQQQLASGQAEGRREGGMVGAAPSWGGGSQPEEPVDERSAAFRAAGQGRRAVALRQQAAGAALGAWWEVLGGQLPDGVAMAAAAMVSTCRGYS